MKKVSIKNYIYLVIVYLFFIGGCLLFVKVYNSYKNNRFETPVIRGKMDELKSVDELINLNYEFNLNKKVLYFSNSKNEDDRELERKVLEYLDNLPGVMKSSDLMVTRSGATTLSEISSLNVLSILVPSPYVTNNHQEKNALTFASSNASILLKEKDFERVDEVIDEILKDKEKIKQIKENLAKFYIADSSKNIVKLIKE